MNTESRLITGIVFILGGFFLIAVPFVWGFLEVWWLSWVYGAIFLIIGFFILFNKNEDKIEKIKFQGGKK